MSTDRRLVRWATTSARLIAGTAVATAAVVGTVVAIAAPWPSLTADPIRLEAVPAPADTVLACDGPLLALGRTIEQAGALSVAAGQDVVSGPDGSALEPSTLSGDAGAETAALRAAPLNDARAPLAAAGSARAADADLAGFAASGCRLPLAESWLVAGATTTGANDLVVLGNPGDVAATVQLSVYGAQGVSTPPGGSGLIVPAGGQRVVPLAGLLLGEESPVVRVVASGAPVHASLQASLTRTLLAGGVDQAAPAAQADTRVVIPGVQVLVAGEAPGTILRLLSPGTDATVTVTATGLDGQPTPAPREVQLTGGLPTSLDLSELQPGAYTIDVRADQPIVAGVWSTTGFGEGADFVWYAAAPVFGAESVIAVAPGDGGALVLVPDGDRATTATLAPADGGAARAIDVPATGVAVDVTAGVYTLSPEAPVRAAVTYASENALAGYPLWPAEAAEPAITVLP